MVLHGAFVFRFAQTTAELLDGLIRVATALMQKKRRRRKLEEWEEEEKLAVVCVHISFFLHISFFFLNNKKVKTYPFS